MVKKNWPNNKVKQKKTYYFHHPNFLIIYLFLQELILCGLRSICKIYANQNPQNFVCLTVWKFVTYMIKKHSTVGYTVPVYGVKIRTMSTLISTVFWKIENKIRLVLFLEWEGYFQHKGFEIKSYSTNQELIMWISQVTFQKRSETGIRNTICNKTWTEEKQSSHTSFGKISSQPHTIVKQICFPYGNVLFLSLLSLSKNWMHNVVWGCAEILPLP